MAETFYGLTTPEFFAKVRLHFHFLFDEYSFVVVDERSVPSQRVRELVTQKGNLCMEIGHEKSSVGVFLYPCSEGKTRGYEIGHFVTFLDREAGNPSKELEQGRFGPEIDQTLDDRSKIIAQLSWYANLLQRYLDRILSLFEKETFKEREAEFVEWDKLWQKQIRKAFSQWLEQNRH